MWKGDWDKEVWEWRMGNKWYSAIQELYLEHYPAKVTEMNRCRAHLSSHSTEKLDTHPHYNTVPEVKSYQHPSTAGIQTILSVVVEKVFRRPLWHTRP